MDELESKRAEQENKSESAQSEEELIQEGKAAAILGYIPFMCFVPLVKMKDNPFAVKHGKQGLILFLLEIIAAVFLFPKISQLFWGMVIILCLVSALVGILNAVQGKEWKIPFIGDLGDKLKL
jgi:fumarate reductase subunit D